MIRRPGLTGKAVKSGDWVLPQVSIAGRTGFVKRLARDGSWADVDWGSHVKRMRTEHLIPTATIPFLGGTVTDMTRKRELETHEASEYLTAEEQWGRAFVAQHAPCGDCGAPPDEDGNHSCSCIPF